MRSLFYPASMMNQTDSFGGFQAELTDIVTNLPIEGATVDIASAEAPDRILEEIQSDASGFTPLIFLPAPPVELSLTPGEVRPYSEYILTFSAPGYEPIRISGAEILSTVTARQRIRLLPSSPTLSGTEEDFTIPDHTLYGSYPPKIAEAEIKEANAAGEIVLDNVVIPEYIVVHDGTPNNSRASNYTVPYRDYIKNVASSEIYATWPESAIYANIMAIQSFTLNRVYTEW